MKLPKSKVKCIVLIIVKYLPQSEGERVHRLIQCLPERKKKLFTIKLPLSINSELRLFIVPRSNTVTVNGFSRFE